MAKLKNFVNNYIKDLKSDKSTDTHVSKKESLSYGISNFGKNASGMILSSGTYLNMFLTMALGLDVVSIGIMLSVSNVIGYLRGPIISLLEDSTKTRWGRFRPYFIVFAPISGILAILFFINPFYGESTMNTIWVYVTYLLYGVATGFSDTAWNGLTKCFAQSSEERGSAFAISKAFGIISTVVPSWLPVLIQFGPQYLGLSLRTIFVIMACFLGVLGLLAVSTARNLRERVMIAHVEKPWKNMGMVFKNKNKIIMWLSSLGGVFSYVANIASPYVLMYCYGAYSMQTFVWGAAGIFAWVALFMSKKVLKKFSPKIVIYLYNSMSIIANVALLVVGYGTGFWYIFAFFVTRCFAAVFEYVDTVAKDMFETDVWDHYEWKYGIRNESTTDLVGGWITAPLSIINPLIYAWVFTKIGFQSGDGVVQTQTTMDGLFYIFLIGNSIANFFTMLPYMLIRLDKKTMKKVRRDLAMRRAARLAVANGQILVADDIPDGIKEYSDNMSVTAVDMNNMEFAIASKEELFVEE